MEMAEIKKRKFKLIQDISKLIHEFAHDTGALVEDIYLESSYDQDSRKLMITIDTIGDEEWTK